jgi:glyoxylase-like metal-dependent hydrolase (beta-lactamase superfamily II)/rhodanese-related sulfurtransferase
MENKSPTIKVDELRAMLEDKEHVVVLDVRAREQREEWQIPGSIYVDAYQRLNANDPTVLDEITIPENSKVVTVCATGKTSQIAANELRKKGIEAYSLEGGMKAWSIAWNVAELKLEEDVQLIQVRRTGKGCLSYIISSRGLAIIIDPSLQVEDYEQILKKNGLQLKYIFETHIHADHLSRAKLLTEKYNAELFLPDKSKVLFSFIPVKDGEVIKLEKIQLEVLYTPGHTLESSCFLINRKALVSGDTLFINGVGRPDLKATVDATKEKAKLLYHSLQRIMALNDDIIVLPAHTSQAVEFDNKVIQTSLRRIKSSVGMLQLNQDDFVNNLLQRIPPMPPNYLSIVEKNVKGDFSDIIPVDLEAGANHCAIS